MSFVVSYDGGAFKRVPAGAWVARCIGLIDLGTQHNERFDSNARKMQLRFEVFGEDEQGVPLTVEVNGHELPMTISKTLTVSLSEKANLRKFLEQWRGKAFTAEELKGFDISKLAGAWCMLNVTEDEANNGKTYSNIASISPVPSAMRKSLPTGVHDIKIFDLDNPDLAVFDSFHDKLREVIKASPEWQRHAGAKNQPPASAAPLADMEDDDTIPF